MLKVSRYFSPVNYLLFWLTVSVAGSLPAQNTASDPDEITRMTVDEIMDDMRRNEALYTRDHSQLDQMVEKRLLPLFNFNAMTQLAVGKFWLQANPEQKERLVREFRTLLVRTYTNMLFANLDKLYSYRDARITTGSSRTLPNGDAIVDVKISNPGREPVLLAIRMRRDREEWKVIDVSANGVSMVVSYRAGFARQANQSGVEGLIKSLVDKNRANNMKLTGRTAGQPEEAGSE